ncbi:MAG: YigZ family protein [Oscillospiraceae bacterium]|jgi:uncharacterized YigZ family protein|nr:YigZ family protein [Oscillospiraceae bacterium]
MGKIYYTISQEGRDEFVVNKSRFICHSKPVTSENDAMSFLEKIRKEFSDANHNVWAYVFGDTRERYNDDGEPQGTAGIPTLNVIRRENLRDVIVVVTRYFGGIKLGAGGLVRAYSQGAKLALDAGKIIMRRPYLSFEITTQYSLSEKLKREYENRGYILKEPVYLEHVTQHILVLPEEKKSLLALTAELTSGQAKIIEGDEVYLDDL